MGDPLHFEPVKPMEKRFTPIPVPEDERPFWLRLIRSLRPSVGTDGTDKKTGATVKTVSITGHADF